MAFDIDSLGLKTSIVSKTTDNLSIFLYGYNGLGKTQQAVKKDMNQFVKNELNATFKTNGKLTSESILRYNNKLAELMNTKVGDVPAPSGRVLRFVAKRGELGVHTALADSGYDMSQLNRGVFGSGKVAYKKENLMKGG